MRKKRNKKSMIKAALLSLVLCGSSICSVFSTDTCEIYAATGGQTSSSDMLNIVLTTSGTIPAEMGALSESSYVAANNTAGQQRGTIALDNTSVGGYMHVNIGQTIDMYAPASDVDYTDVIGFSGNYTFKAAGGKGGNIYASDSKAGSNGASGNYGSVITNSLIDYNTGQSITYRKGSNGRNVGTSEATNTTYWNNQTNFATLETYMGNVNGLLGGWADNYRAYTAVAQVGTASYIQVNNTQYIVAGGGAPGVVLFECENGRYSASARNGIHADLIPALTNGADGFYNPSAPNMTKRYRDYEGTSNINAGRIAGVTVKNGVRVSSGWGGGVQYEDVFYGWVSNAAAENKGLSEIYPGYSGLASRSGSKFSTQGLSDSAYSVSIDSSATQSSPYLKLTCNAKYITINNPTRRGYTFTGWTCGNGVSVVSNNGSSYKFKVTSSGATITANWKVNTNTIAYNANGGTGSMSAQAVVTEGTFAIKNNGFTAPSGYMFDDTGYVVVRASDNAVYCTNYGWQSLSNSIGSNPANWQRYTQGSQYVLNSSWLNPNHSGGETFTFYAQWKLAIYYIAYDKGQTDWNGTVPAATQCIYTQNVTLQGIGDIKGRSYTISFDSNKTKGEGNPTTAEDITGNLVGTGWKINNGLYNFGAFLIAPNFIESGTINAIAQWETKTINNLPTVTREGFTKYKVMATDTSGNTATLKVTVKIDYVVPLGGKTVDYSPCADVSIRLTLEY